VAPCTCIAWSMMLQTFSGTIAFNHAEPRCALLCCPTLHRLGRLFRNAMQGASPRSRSWQREMFFHVLPESMIFLPKAIRGSARRFDIIRSNAFSADPDRAHAVGGYGLAPRRNLGDSKPAAFARNRMLLSGTRTLVNFDGAVTHGGAFVRGQRQCIGAYDFNAGGRRLGPRQSGLWRKGSASVTS